jgi:uncharacterized membrane protein
MTVGSGIGLAALGAILLFAVEFSIAGLDISVVGVILMIAGLAIVVLGLVGRRRTITTTTPGSQRVVERDVVEREM